jgi:hypothetical protein
MTAVSAFPSASGSASSGIKVSPGCRRGAGSRMGVACVASRRTPGTARLGRAWCSLGGVSKRPGGPRSIWAPPGSQGSGGRSSLADCGGLYRRTVSASIRPRPARAPRSGPASSYAALRSTLLVPRSRLPLRRLTATGVDEQRLDNLLVSVRDLDPERANQRVVLLDECRKQQPPRFAAKQQLAPEPEP